ncbi:acetyl-lysine aminotransferase [Pyrodictium occultum]|uniref:Putative [LysW]-aminoadipate semialdehyde/glutamate semialdehyde transaminase n=1 Tax=Pyrodictium occultum TaxID=2309 RepID=A0A0V8RX15_PYROC|nr:aspartate aminotransferase family protein [Pyrodictium occultum]KSW12590.1 acetyl-lysine aminotransferase [Pyrodictium occultum]
MVLRYLHFYAPRGLRVARAQGQYIWDLEGRRYLDAHTGHGVAFLGHRHPRIVEALREALDTVMVAPPGMAGPWLEEMLEALTPLLPGRMEYVTLLNSGAEAVELALKIARRVTGRRGIVYFTGSFHGRTMGALSVTSSNPLYRKGYEPLIPGTRRARFNHPEDLDKAIGEDTAAAIVEPIQGEGGVNPATPEFMKELRRRCDEAGCLLVVDEVQTGFGRTGRVWAHEHYGVEPDILAAGKAIGGGFPVSMVAVPGWVAEKLPPGFHGSTYGGNPMAMKAVAAASRVLVEERVPEQAAEKGARLRGILEEMLEGARVVRRVKGMGLMIGVELRLRPDPVLRCLQEEKAILALKAGSTVVRLLPPYLLAGKDVEALARGVADCVLRLQGG